MLTASVMHVARQDTRRRNISALQSPTQDQSFSEISHHPQHHDSLEAQPSNELHPQGSSSAYPTLVFSTLCVQFYMHVPVYCCVLLCVFGSRLKPPPLFSPFYFSMRGPCVCTTPQGRRMLSGSPASLHPHQMFPSSPSALCQRLLLPASVRCFAASRS